MYILKNYQGNIMPKAIIFKAQSNLEALRFVI